MSTKLGASPAFPPSAFYHPTRESATNAEVEGYSSGMTLRQWYAGQALSGLAANAKMIEAMQTVSRNYTDRAIAGMAKLAVDYADALLVQESK